MEFQDFFKCFDISASGLKAEQARMDVVARNIANAGVTRGQGGGPYRRQEVLFETVLGRRGRALGGVRVAGVVPDESPFLEIYNPSHPQADPETGMVLMPNVKIPFEMVDMISAARAYEANLNLMKYFRDMVERALQMGR